MSKKPINSKIENFPQKIYKLSKTNTFFSHFEGTRGEEKTNISHPSHRNLTLIGLCFGDQEIPKIPRSEPTLPFTSPQSLAQDLKLE